MCGFLFFLEILILPKYWRYVYNFRLSLWILCQKLSVEKLGEWNWESQNGKSSEKMCKWYNCKLVNIIWQWIQWFEETPHSDISFNNMTKYKGLMDFLIVFNTLHNKLGWNSFDRAHNTGVFIFIEDLTTSDFNCELHVLSWRWDLLERPTVPIWLTLESA